MDPPGIAADAPWLMTRPLSNPGKEAPATAAAGEAGSVPTTDSVQRRRALVPRSRGRTAMLGRFGVLGAFAITFAVFAILRTTFLEGDNLKAILSNSTPLAILAFGLTVALSMGDFDLSVAAMADLAGAVAIVLMSKHGASWWVAILIALAVGAVGGAINGGLVAYAGASSFVITLAMGLVFNGVEFSVTKQQTITESIPKAYGELSSRQILGFNLQVFIALGALVVLYVLMDRMELGRYMRAIGGSRDAAYLSGINVRRLRLIGFAIVGVTAAMAGVLVTSQAASTTPDLATGLLLPAFAAAFLGSAAFRPGEFNIFGTLLGVLFLGVIQNGLTLLNASTAVIYMVEGGILAFAVLLTRLGRAEG